MPEIPENIRLQLQEHLIGIGKLFKSPHITLIVRGGDNAPGDLVLSADDPVAVLKVLQGRVRAHAKAAFEPPSEKEEAHA